MYRDKYFREWVGPFPFDAAAVAGQKAADHPGVYQILRNKQPVYIGVSSVSALDPLKKHVSGAGNKPARGVIGNSSYEFVYWLCDAESARQIESHVTVNEKPEFNQKVEYINYILSIMVH